MSNVHQGLEVMVTMLVGTFVLPRQRGGTGHTTRRLQVLRRHSG